MNPATAIIFQQQQARRRQEEEEEENLHPWTPSSRSRPIGGDGGMHEPFIDETFKLETMKLRQGLYRDFFDDRNKEEQERQKKKKSFWRYARRIIGGLGMTVMLTGAHASVPEASISDNCTVVYTANGETRVTSTGMVEGIIVGRPRAEGWRDVVIRYPQHSSFSTVAVGMWFQDADKFIKRFNACTGMVLPNNLK